MDDSNSKEGRGWKNAVISSGLALEHCVLDILDKRSLHIDGEYPYIRPNEAGVPTEFSADFLCVYDYESPNNNHATADFIIECKYNNPSKNWIFLPSAGNTYVDSFYPPIAESLCTMRIADVTPFGWISDELSYAVKGIVVDEKHFDPNLIRRGLSQLQWAMPNLLKPIIRLNSTSVNDEDLSPHFLCPILVTNAPLYILKEGLTLNAFYRAENLQDLAHQVESLIFYERPGPQLSDYIDDIRKSLYRDYPSVEKRLNSFQEAIGTETEKKYFSKDHRLREDFDNCTELVLVVTLSAFEHYFDKLIGSVAEAAERRRRVAHIEFDGDIFNSWVVAPESTGS